MHLLGQMYKQIPSLDRQRRLGRHSLWSAPGRNRTRTLWSEATWSIR